MNLEEFFEENPTVAIAFSGGVDSAYLLYAALKYGADARAYYVKTDFQPAFEFEDAKRLAAELKADMQVIYLNALADENVRINPKNRCYYCKQHIFGAIKSQAVKDGYQVLLDGTNASDDANDRPGMKALEELKVLSPLRICGLKKQRIRELSKEAGLFTWDKPAYACLATRIPTGTEITGEKLAITEAAEEFLSSIGFYDFRVRWNNGKALLQVREEQLTLALEKRQQILEHLGGNYSGVVLDMEVRE